MILNPDFNPRLESFKQSSGDFPTQMILIGCCNIMNFSTKYENTMPTFKFQV